MVYKAKDLLPNDETAGWDGTMGNTPSPVGAYIYIMELEFLDGVRKSVQGDVSLMR